MSYWILLTHTASLFPIGVYLWSWKIRKDSASVYMFFHTIFVVFFSILYHTEHVAESNLSNLNNSTWTFLDSSQSAILIITTIFYGLRIREPQFYIASYVSSMIMLILYLFKYYNISVYIMSIFCCSTGLIKWRTIWRYIRFYYYNTFLTIFFAICAIICFIAASEHENMYIIYHSLWHFFIFFTAGFGSLLRYKLDQKLYPISRTRDTLYSNEMIVIHDNNENENENEN
tara:strand:- start:714 stop:1403 length:690 start_codon:yes stop_codon:yes gene_type:complete